MTGTLTIDLEDPFEYRTIVFPASDAPDLAKKLNSSLDGGWFIVGVCEPDSAFEGGGGPHCFVVTYARRARPPRP